MKPQTYRALQTAAEKIGAANYSAGLAAHVKKGRKPSTYRYAPTPEHREIVEAMGSRTISDDEAMGLLHQYDTMKQRFPT